MSFLATPGPKERLVSLNASTGAFKAIFATQLTRRVEIEEDASGAETGFQYQIPNDGTANGFTTVFSIQPIQEPLVLGEQIAENRGHGAVLGNGPDASGGFTIPATQLCNLRSVGAATVVRIREFS